jgi:hypothetical protein
MVLGIFSRKILKEVGNKMDMIIFQEVMESGLEKMLKN